MNIAFLSRHAPTHAQRETIRAAFGPDTELQHAGAPVFQAGHVVQQVREIVGPAQVVAVVAPTWANLELLRAGLEVVEFENVPSARARGVFLCRGLWRHTLHSSQFVPCPVPEGEQEESSLAPML